MNQQVRTASGLNILFGLWLIISPFVLSFAGSTGMWDAVIVGVIGVVLAWIRYASPDRAPILSWINALLGIWLIISPFLFGMAGVTALLWDYIIVGIAFVVFGAWSALSTPKAVV